MKLNKFFLIGMAVGTFFLGSCKSEDDVTQRIKEESVTVSMPRAQVEGQNSVNTDITDFEDRVNTLAVLAFNNSDGGKVGEYYETVTSGAEPQHQFQMKVVPGTNTFYFVANMNLEDLKGIRSKSQMETYVTKLNDSPASLYKGATASVAFPMYRKLENITITSAATQAFPNNIVTLERVFAKVEVNVVGIQVASVKYGNASRQYRLAPKETVGEFIAPGNFVEKTAGTPTVKGTYICYIPEVKFAAQPVWSAANHASINYFEIKDDANKTYIIPIINNAASAYTTSGYLNFATGVSGTGQDYNIIRNKRYIYDVNLTREIEVHYQVLDWTPKNYNMYMGYGYNVVVSDTEVFIQNTVEQCDPFKVELVAKNGATVNGATSVTFNTFTLNAISTYPINKNGLTSGYLDVKLNDRVVYSF